jgi:hypothetical protein
MQTAGSNDFGDNHEVIPKLGEIRQEGGNLVFKKLWPMDREGLTELIDKLRDLDMELSSFHPEGAKLIRYHPFSLLLRLKRRAPTPPFLLLNTNRVISSGRQVIICWNIRESSASLQG